MPRKKTRKSFLQTVAQVPLILLLSVSARMVLAQGAAAQVISPENSQSGVTPTPGESYSRRVAEFEGRSRNFCKAQKPLFFRRIGARLML